MKTLLHLGCGFMSASLPDHREIRVDMDESVEPDHVGPVHDLPFIADGEVSVVLAQHVLEHLEPREGVRALKEWLRVLSPEGHAVIAVPDMREASRRILDGAEAMPAVVYGPHAITPLDIIYGARRHMPDHLGHRHAWGFTDATLAEALQSAGFVSIAIKQDAALVQLIAIATKTVASCDDLAAKFPQENAA